MQWPKVNELNNRTKKRLTASGVTILVAGLASASIFATGPSAEPTAVTEKPWPVSTMQVKRTDIRPSFGAFGKVEATNTAQIRTELVANVDEVLVREGDWAEKDELLVKLDQQELALKVAERQASLAGQRALAKTIKSDFQLAKKTSAHFKSSLAVANNKQQRHEQLRSQKLISDSLLDEVTRQANDAKIAYQRHQQLLTNFPNKLASARAQIDRDNALLGQSQLALDRTEIRAPFSGPVLSVSVSPGDRTNLGGVLMEIADAASFEVRVQVPGQYVNELAENLRRKRHKESKRNNESKRRKRSTITALTDQNIVLQLSRLAGKVMPGHTGVDAFFQIVVAQDQTLPAIGRVLDVNVNLPVESNLIAIPTHALYDGDLVYTIDDNRLVPQQVDRIGETTLANGQYRLLVRAKKIVDGQSILTTALPKAIEGMLVSSTRPIN